MFLSDPIVSWEHAVTFFSGMTFLGIVAHAVNTFPTPASQYGQWFLGIVKYAVGQRISAMNAFKGNDTMVVAVPQGTGTGSGLAKASEVATSHTEVTPTEVKVSSEKVTKSETTVPIAGDVKKGGE